MKDKKRPNMLLITLDCLRYDALHCNGEQSVITPTFDKLAKNGVSFDRNYCPYPLCMPSRSSILTGRYPMAHGVWTNGVELNENEISLVEVLRDNGYQTSCFGKFHFKPYRNKLTEPDLLENRQVNMDGIGWLKEAPDEPSHYKGFEVVKFADNTPNCDYHAWFDEKNKEYGYKESLAIEEIAVEQRKFSWVSKMPAELTKTDWICNEAKEYFDKKLDRDRPFFSWISILDPHLPYNPPEEFAKMLENAKVRKPYGFDKGIPERPKHYTKWFDYIYKHFGSKQDVLDNWQDIIRRYWAKVTHADDRVGKLLDFLESQGLLENTIVVVTSDHGTMLCDHQMIACGPHSFEGNVHIPLIWHAPGIIKESVRRNELVSLVDLLPTFFDIAGIQLPLGVQGKSYKGLLTGEKYEKRRNLIIESRMGQDLTGFKTIITDGGWKMAVYTNRVDGELYNLNEDPEEINNLFYDESYNDKKLELFREFAYELLLLEDPLPVRTSDF
ncbi:MAG TPA: sulfatase-like hydrolase/transferase [Clostridiaceae bacterium]|nr:sulfatase-like hydrolase/transferase [Clostridiaceae bacterium]